MPCELSEGKFCGNRDNYCDILQEEDLPRAWWADIRHEEVAWWQEGWQATPAPAAPTEHRTQIDPHRERDATQEVKLFQRCASRLG